MPTKPTTAASPKTVTAIVRSAPKPPKIEAAFFDVDNTLLRGSSIFLFGKAAFKRKFFSRQDFWNFAWHQMRFIARGETANSLQQIRDRALALVAGHKVESLASLTDEVYDFYISPKLWPETVRLAQKHVREGREVWLVTAAPAEIAKVIAHRLGLTGGLGTLIARENGVLTGELEGVALHGKAKRKAVKRLAKERNISLRNSYAYSDSHNDLPMLTAVGHAVAVNPDKILTVHARAAGWKILDFKRRELKANK
ncbi:MAG: HAD-IB family hydrolase, partial [Actinomycetes bacterium]